MTSSLYKLVSSQTEPKTVYGLLEANIGHQVYTSFDTFRQKDISSRCDSHNMRVFTEGLEGDGIVDFTGGLA